MIASGLIHRSSDNAVQVAPRTSVIFIDRGGILNNLKGGEECGGGGKEGIHLICGWYEEGV